MDMSEVILIKPVSQNTQYKKSGWQNYSVLFYELEIRGPKYGG
jgi:hypothetical protein